MGYLDNIAIDSDAKRKISEMGLSNAEELVSTIRASEDACRNHLGTSVVDVILEMFKDKDNGKYEGDLPKMGLLMNKLPESKL